MQIVVQFLLAGLFVWLHSGFDVGEDEPGKHEAKECAGEDTQEGGTFPQGEDGGNGGLETLGRTAV